MAKAWVHLLLAVVIVALTTALLGACGDSSSDDRGAAMSDEQADALVQRLREGGNVLLLRHAATDNATDMTADFDDCTRQRNLSAQGRRQALTIGHAIRRLDVPVGTALSSFFCRARDTARIAVGIALRSRALLPPDVLETVGRENDPPAYGLRWQLRGWLRNESNTMLVSHESTIAEATGRTVDEGETLVVARAAREPGYKVLARLSPADWAYLADR